MPAITTDREVHRARNTPSTKHPAVTPITKIHIERGDLLLRWSYPSSFATSPQFDLAPDTGRSRYSFDYENFVAEKRIAFDELRDGAPTASKPFAFATTGSENLKNEPSTSQWRN
jgi:hypothetical protein